MWAIGILEFELTFKNLPTVIDYQYLQKHPRVFKCVIGISSKRFHRLSWRFHRRVLKARKERPKVRRYGGGRKPLRFDDSNKLLLYILLFVRIYPTYDLAQAIFELDRANLHRWFEWGSGILEETLGYKLLMPLRKTRSLGELFRKIPELRFHIVDATEQARNRPKFNQREFYSGKKKMHTVKRQIVTTIEGDLLSISSSVPGKTHDKTLADRTMYMVHAPPLSQALADGAYVKMDRFGSDVRVITPNRRLPKKDLTEAQRVENRLISSRRVKIEHVICHLKYFRMFRERIRYRNIYDDRVSNIVGGLYNFKRN